MDAQDAGVRDSVRIGVYARAWSLHASCLQYDEAAARHRGQLDGELLVPVDAQRVLAWGRGERLGDGAAVVGVKRRIAAGARERDGDAGEGTLRAVA